MIISFWFRDLTRDGTKPQPDPGNVKIKQWPQGFWTEGGGPASNRDTMLPPNAQYSVSYDSDWHCSTTWWNGYGLPQGGFIMDAFFMGPSFCWIPSAPPVATNTMSDKQTIDGIADIDMNEFGVRTLITFGDDKIPYIYNKWTAYEPGVLDFVDYTLPAILNSDGIILPLTPPPYKVHPQGGPCGGHYKVKSWKLGAKVNKGYMPQSFIGIDKDGNIVINLQTNTFGEYKGMAFEQERMETLWAVQSTSKIIGGYTQLGWPFPDIEFIYAYGGERYWNGYWFYNKDVSQEVMGAVPESFYICGKMSAFLDLVFGPTITDGGWHHILFSCDLSGECFIETPTVRDTHSPFYSEYAFPEYTDGPLTVHAIDPKAWLSVDDNNITGKELQNTPPVHDGYHLAKLRGTQTTAILDCGPTGAYSRGEGKSNWILPRNGWLNGCWGNPNGALMANGCITPVLDMGAYGEYGCDSKFDIMNCTGDENGDYAVTPWSASLWVLYGGCNAVAPGPWHGYNIPKKPYYKEPGDTESGPYYRASNFQIPLAGKPIGIPCITGIGKGAQAMGAMSPDYNPGVEMAELQIWVGQSLDTGSVQNRRLFLDYPLDKHGKPDTSKPLQPVDPGVAQKRLGRPDILLHGTNNWKTGFNTGKSGVRIDGHGKQTIIKAGQFQVHHKVEKFTPDPKLGQ